MPHPDWLPPLIPEPAVLHDYLTTGESRPQVGWVLPLDKQRNSYLRLIDFRDRWELQDWRSSSWEGVSMVNRTWSAIHDLIEEEALFILELSLDEVLELVDRKFIEPQLRDKR